MKTKSIYSIVYHELLIHKYKKKELATHFFFLHEALAVYFPYLCIQLRRSWVIHSLSWLRKLPEWQLTLQKLVRKENCPQLLPLLLCREHHSKTIQHS